MENVSENKKLENQVMDLFIFRTNIESHSDFSRLRNDLEKIPGFQVCTIDLDDSDKVLRVGCENIPMEAVVEEVVRHGFFCEELAD